MIGGYQLVDLKDHVIEVDSNGEINADLISVDVASKLSVNKPVRVKLYLKDIYGIIYDYYVMLTQHRITDDGIVYRKGTFYNDSTLSQYSISFTIDGDETSVEISKVTTSGGGGGGGGSSFPIDVFVADFKNTDLHNAGYSIKIDGIYSACVNNNLIIAKNAVCYDGLTTPFVISASEVEATNEYSFWHNLHTGLDWVSGYITPQDIVYTNE